MSGRPLPRIDRDSQPFWDGCKAGEFRVQRCTRCADTRFPPGEFCPRCHSQAAEWITLPGTGTVQSFVIVHRAFDPNFSDDVPYIVGMIALDATSPLIVFPANVRGIDPERVHIGLPVVAHFEPREAVVMAAFIPTDGDV